MRRGKGILSDCHNLTMQMNVTWFALLIDAFSKRAENHSHALGLYFVFYNFRSSDLWSGMATGPIGYGHGRSSCVD